MDDSCILLTPPPCFLQWTNCTNTLQLATPSLRGYFPPEFTGCLFDAAQSVEHMNEGRDGLVAMGQPRRQADRAERETPPHIWDLCGSYYYSETPFSSITCDLGFIVLTEMIENWSKITDAILVVRSKRELRGNIPKVMIGIQTFKMITKLCMGPSLRDYLVPHRKQLLEVNLTATCSPTSINKCISHSQGLSKFIRAAGSGPEGDR